MLNELDSQNAIIVTGKINVKLSLINPLLISVFSPQHYDSTHFISNNWRSLSQLPTDFFLLCEWQWFAMRGNEPQTVEEFLQNPWGSFLLGWYVLSPYHALHDFPPPLCTKTPLTNFYSCSPRCSLFHALLFWKKEETHSHNSLWSVLFPILQHYRWYLMRVCVSLRMFCGFSSNASSFWPYGSRNIKSWEVNISFNVS